MLGILYLLLCFTTGYSLCSLAFPELSMVPLTAYDKRKILLSPYFLLFPVWFCTGTIFLSWLVYIIASMCYKTKAPLTIANGIILPIAIIFFIVVLIIRLRNKSHISLICKDRKIIKWELLFLIIVMILAIALMWTTFNVQDGKLNVGISVFSDFSPHLGMIRSFSYGNNFPTSYSHFAGEDIKYHFMFQFFVGNLEYLGLRIDYAFNIPSIISFISAFLLLYVLAVKITGKALVGALSCTFFAFRSAKTLFTYLASVPRGFNQYKSLSDNMEFISDTPNESWGLWNLNVYANQRHLALGLCIMLFVIIMFLPYLYEMFEAIKNLGFIIDRNRKKLNTKKDKYKTSYFSSAASYIKLIFFSKEAWLDKNIGQAVALGIILGALSFFHGAAVIGCLLMLFVMAAMSKRRMGYLITAVITVLLSVIQTRYFIEGSAVSTNFYFGFIAENRTIFGVLSYLERLLGILPFVILAYLCVEKGINRYLVPVFFAPLIFAFTVSLTVDVTVNHKYIMMSCMMLGILAAILISKMLLKKDILLRIVGVLLIIALTSTGIYDFIIVIRKNTSIQPIVLDLEDPLTEWINKNSTSRDIFLTSSYALNNIVFGGAMLYQGHQYYAWSAGYDTEYRDVMVRQMYEADTPEELDKLVNRNNIRYIVIDHDNRESKLYQINEANIMNTYQRVYNNGDESDWNISIYDTKKPL